MAVDTVEQKVPAWEDTTNGRHGCWICADPCDCVSYDGRCTGCSECNEDPDDETDDDDD